MKRMQKKRDLRKPLSSYRRGAWEWCVPVSSEPHRWEMRRAQRNLNAEPIVEHCRSKIAFLHLLCNRLLRPAPPELSAIRKPRLSGRVLRKRRRDAGEKTKSAFR